MSLSILDLLQKKRAAASAAKPQCVEIAGRRYKVCEECGTPVDDYGRVEKACNLLGKRLCTSCFQRLRKTATVVCEKCGKTIPYLEMTQHLCPSCWSKYLSSLRDFHSGYHARLSNFLSKQGITVLPPSTEYLDESGRASFPIVPSATDCIPLRKDVHGNLGGDECALFTVKIGDAIFALPNHGIGIRYLKAGADCSLPDHAYSLAKSSYILALASDGNDLFLLNDRGTVLSTRPNWKACPLFDAIEEVLTITHRYFDDATISAAVQQYEQGVTSSLVDKISYDCEQKAFIEYVDCGSSHDGIERVYEEISRQDVLQQLSQRSFHLQEIVFAAQKGTVPLISIVERLAVHDNGTKIHVPESKRMY